MTDAPHALWALLVVPACFHPTYDHPACGPNGECPHGLTCSAQLLCEGGGGGGAIGDAQNSDAQSSNGSTDCLGHWLDGSIMISAPQPFANQSSTGADERDPWISTDGLRLYYAYDPIGATTSDIYLASRASIAQPFGNGTAVTNLNTNSNEVRASLTADEKTLVLASNLGGQFDIYLSTRPTTTMMFATGGKQYLGNIDTASVQHYDPFLTADGLKLYLAPDPDGNSQHIFVATRTDANSDFLAATLVPVINGAIGGDADPALSLDERIIVFSSMRPAGAGMGRTNLWYATRQEPAQDFGPPKLIPTVNSDSDDGDPMLGADGCTLYFSSTRTGKSYDLYTAQITR